MSASIDQRGNMEVATESKAAILTEHQAEAAKLPAMDGVETVTNGDVSERVAGECVGSSDSEREPSPLSPAVVEVAAGNPTGHQKKEQVKARRREDKAIDAVLKALSSLSTTEEKLAALCKKYADLLEENKLLQHKFKQGQKSLSVIMKEKDQLQSDHSKAVLAKSKLESLCRELQRHNKLIKEESVARTKEEEEKRKEVTSKFQTTINDIQSQMNEHYQKNGKLREENVELANKLKSLIEQYELREQHIEKVFKHKELEQQLADAKYAQINLQMSEQKEQHLGEKTLLITEAQQYIAKITILEEQEKHLRAQVAMYTDKYEEFQSTLAKSNDVFQSFKTEMDKMTKKIKKLEKETTMWRSRWENSNRALLEMAEEKTRSDKAIATLNNKQSKLESLCRALQEERRTKTATPNGVVSNEQSSKKEDAEPTKTPPNTPTPSSRASPVTVNQSNTQQQDQTASKPDQSSPKPDASDSNQPSATQASPTASDTTSSEEVVDEKGSQQQSKEGDVTDSQSEKGREEVVQVPADSGQSENGREGVVQVPADSGQSENWKEEEVVQVPVDSGQSEEAAQKFEPTGDIEKENNEGDDKGEDK